jgi:hypothetical protein
MGKEKLLKSITVLDRGRAISDAGGEDPAPESSVGRNRAAVATPSVLHTTPD